MNDRRTQMIEIHNLRLGPQNPRLPENLHNAAQETLLVYLYEYATLDELALSFVDNGFFAHEPLIVSEPDSTGIHDVLEGNRRLAALLILLQHETAEIANLAFGIDPIPTSEQLARLGTVPCVVVGEEIEVHRFLGFRHIGGIKTWSPEAKARYILSEVKRAHAREPSSDAFLTVARAVGSNVQGVRNPYLALSILRYGQEQFGIDVAWIQRNRFGVWNRAMNAPGIRHYIGFGDARTVGEIQASLTNIEENPLVEVLDDMVPSTATGEAVLNDSRDVTIYAQILHDRLAHQVLREHNNLEVARQVIEKSSMALRIEEISKSVRILNREIERQGAPAEALEPAHELARLVRSLIAIVDDSIDFNE